MAEVADSRDMDAYLINPTLKMDAGFEESHSRNMAGDLIPIFLSDQIFTIKAGKKTVESTGKIHKLPDEPIFTHSYNSEEEAASPTEDDDEDFYSLTDTESDPSVKVTPSLEDLSDYQSHAVQLCTKAQAVRFVSAGKAKVVSLSKQIPPSDAGSSIRSLSGDAGFNQWYYMPPKLSLDKSVRIQSTRSSTDGSEGWNSSLPQPPQRNVLRRKANLPRLQPLLTQSSQRSAKAKGQTPLSQQRADFRSGTASSIWPQYSPTSPTSSKRSQSKVSPTLKLKGFGRSRKTSTSDSSSIDEKYYEWYGDANSLSTASIHRDLSKAERKALPKMVARGAGERAAPIILPPCPHDQDDYDNNDDDQWEIRYATAWPLRDSSNQSN